MKALKNLYKFKILIMALTPDDLKKIDVDLSKITVPNYSYYLPLATGGNPPVAITLDNAVRKAVTLIETGISGAYTADFDSYSEIIINCTGNVTITPDNVPTGQVCKLVVIRSDPDTQTVAFSGIGGTVDGINTGVSNLYYDIWQANSSIQVIQKNRQYSGSITGITSTILTSISLERGVYQINDNICTFSLRFSATTVTSPDEINISISSFNVDNKYTNEAVSVTLLDTGLSINKAKSALMESPSSIVITCDTVGSGRNIEISLNGSFIVE